jgi:hypothetical protein
MRVVARSPVALFAVALLMTSIPAPALARAGSSSEVHTGSRPPAVPAFYTGWIDIDLVRSWNAPNPNAWLVENFQHLFVRRFRVAFNLTPASGSNPPSRVSIDSGDFQFYGQWSQRFEPPPEAGDVCRGSIVQITGEGSTAAFRGSASGSSAHWSIPGIRFNPSPTTPDITFYSGNCEPGRSPLEQSLLAGLRTELSMPGDVTWEFTEGLREPLSSSTPRWIEGSCDAPVYLATGGRLQCHWELRPGPPRLVPPRRR